MSCVVLKKIEEKFWIQAKKNAHENYIFIVVNHKIFYANFVMKNQITLKRLFSAVYNFHGGWLLKKEVVFILP